MSWPSKIYVATRTLGVYYTSNFQDPATQPTWVTVNGGLPTTDVRQFALDPFQGATRQYLMLESSKTLYRRDNGGDWAAILTNAEVRTLVSETADGYIKAFHMDETVDGRIWVIYEGHNASGDEVNTIQALYSDDYGDTWSTTTRISAGWVSERTARSIVACGNNVFAIWNSGSGVLCSCSTNKGASWIETNISLNENALAMNALEPEYAYYSGSATYGYLFRIDTAGTIEELVTNIHGFDNGGIWFAAADANHQRAVYNAKLYATADGWANESTAGTIIPAPISIAPWAGADEDQVIVGLYIDTPQSRYHAVGVLYGEDDTSAVGIAGANCATSPYTDSIPCNCGGVSLWGVQAVRETPSEGPTPPEDETITPPGGSPVTLGGTANTQAVTMPGYTGNLRGEPLPGDRGAWAVDTEAHAALHASDIADDAPVYHNPADAETGEAPIWDGSKWVPADVLTPAEHTAIGNNSPHHAPVTLGATSDEALALAGQELTLTLPALANHDHSGDAGDGGTFDAANLSSGAATDGQVLTADGAGGADWKDQEGGGGVDLDARRLIWMGW